MQQQGRSIQTRNTARSLHGRLCNTPQSQHYALAREYPFANAPAPAWVARDTRGHLRALTRPVADDRQRANRSANAFGRARELTPSSNAEKSCKNACRNAFGRDKDRPEAPPHAPQPIGPCSPGVNFASGRSNRIQIGPLLFFVGTEWASMEDLNTSRNCVG